MLPEDAEGVVKFHLDFTPTPPPDPGCIGELNAWRTVLYRLGLTGRDPNRYGGLAYGNVSIRLTGDQFLISGTQTGGFAELGVEHFCGVTHFDAKRNLIEARGPIRPSSEALTHGAAYLASPMIRCVLHVHSPELWSCAENLGIPVTCPHVGYGTPEMAEEVAGLLSTPGVRLIAMGGHRDGLIAAGESVETAAVALIGPLARSIQARWERAARNDSGA